MSSNFLEIIYNKIIFKLSRIKYYIKYIIDVETQKNSNYNIV